MTGPLLSYVYAVGRSRAPLDAAATEVSGQDGSTLRSVPAAGLRALVSSVPADRFDEAALRDRLEDLQRLESVARCHHAVVEAAFRHGTVLPMRLATLCRDDDRVAELLGARAEEFGTLLDRLEGRSEWGVKVYVDGPDTPRPGAAPAAEASGPDTAAASPGRDYLRRRRAQRDAARRTHQAAESLVGRLAETAAGMAAATVAHRPQQGELATGPGENVANHAYLVDTEHGESFAAALSGLAAESPGVRVEVTGPWAPYSFTASDA